MKLCTRRLKGTNSAAIASVEATMASWESPPVKVRKTYWRETTLADVHHRQRRRERAVDEGAVDHDVYVVEAVAQDSDAHRNREADEGEGHEVLD